MISLSSLPLAGGGAFKHAEDVALLHDEEVLIIDLNFGAGPLAEQHPIAGLDVERLYLALLIAGTRACSDDLALLGLFLSSIGNNNAATGALVLLDAAVVQRTKLHVQTSSNFLSC